MGVFSEGLTNLRFYTSPAIKSGEGDEGAIPKPAHAAVLSVSEKYFFLLLKDCM